MQNQSSFQPIPPSPSCTFPEQEHLKCPRCDSKNTKFCYYNNYNLSQPRHFCKNCRRYWTKGGALRNIPIGGGTRKTTKRSTNLKRPSSSETSSSAQTPSFAPKPEQIDQGIGTSLVDQDRQLLDITGSFSSLLASNGQFGNLFQGLTATCSPSLPTLQCGDFTEHSNSSCIENPTTLDLPNTNHPERDTLLSIQGGGDSLCWENASGNGWPDLAIYTPGSNFE